LPQLFRFLSVREIQGNTDEELIGFRWYRKRTDEPWSIYDLFNPTRWNKRKEHW